MAVAAEQDAVGVAGVRECGERLEQVPVGGVMGSGRSVERQERTGFGGAAVGPRVG
nr:hypothetical protein [Actinomadura darangshiensis]